MNPAEYNITIPMEFVAAFHKEVLQTGVESLDIAWSKVGVGTA
jgi:hypothetical protein